MPVYNAFAPSVLGLQSQAQSLGTISQNIANATTGGYKRTETRFQTVLSQSLQQQSDLGGSRPIDVQMIDNQGVVLTTTRDLDLAIVGDGFFVVSTAITGGNTFYTRDGSFDIKAEAAVTSGTTTTTPGYLVDKNGYYLMGWVPDATGVFPTSGAVQALRVDPDNFANSFLATTKFDLGVNLPAAATLIPGTRQVDTVTFTGTIEAGDVYSITVGGTTLSYTTTGGEANIDAVRDNLISQVNGAALGVTASANGTGVVRLSANTPGTAFTATGGATNGGVTADNTAAAATVTANITAAAAHATAVTNANSGSPPDGFYSYSISVVDSAGNRKAARLNFTRSAANTWEMSATYGSPATTTATTTLTFNGKGVLTSPTAAIALSLNFGTTTASFNLDLSTSTQFDTGFTALSQNADGFDKSNLNGLSWDQDGYLVGDFSNGNSRRLYKLPLAYFTSPNNLVMRNGMVFEQSELSGTPRIEDPNANGKALFAAGAVESSNVDLAGEFSRMIQTQAVYNANALAFRTNDELTTTIRDLVRA